MEECNYEIKRCLFADEKDFVQLAELQGSVYSDRQLYFNREYFEQWYIHNPVGRVLSFNAYHGDIMIAHYACIPKIIQIDGRLVKGIHSMATVTHPSYRGKGLFKKLAQLTYDCAKEEGYEFVSGVANANSFPGFMKYFPFQFVSKLDVKYGIGCNIKTSNKQFKGYWDKEMLEWRLKCAGANYYNNKKVIFGKYRSYINTVMGVFDGNMIKSLKYNNEGKSFTPFRLYVGIGAEIKGLYFNMPKFIKHSPFNLIFMDLTEGKLPVPTKDNFFFQLIDFDVA